VIKHNAIKIAALLMSFDSVRWILVKC